MIFRRPKQKARTKVQLMPLAQKGRRVRRQVWKIVGFTLGGLVLFFGLVTAYYYPKAKVVMTEAKTLQDLGKKIPQAISDQDFTRAHTLTTDLQASVTRAQNGLHKMQGLRWWPYIGRQYRAGDDLLTVADHGADGVSALVDFADQLFAPFADRGKVSLASITPEEKGILLAGISEHEDTLRQAHTAIDASAQALDHIPDTGLIGPLERIVKPLKEQFPLLQQGLAQAIPATRILPSILGYPETKTYLFLLENNTELRPGGGFIGTYGILRLNSGEIVSLQTENSYNLDEAAKSLSTVTPPAPISKYLKVYNWYFRDANWSPDFPTSARQSLVLYQREGGRKDVDGVIAVTPTAISALLDLVGPIKIGSIEFSADNFVDKLQKYVDLDFRVAGLNEADRKDIIGPLTKELVDRLLQLPVSDWGGLFLTLSQQLHEKQMLLYVNDAATQGILEDQNWAGSIHTDEQSDSVMVVDANLASLKSDPVVKRSYDYQVSVRPDAAEATLTITYNHTGKFDWKTTRYNTYVRVYVPEGSTLLDSSGAQLREKSQRAGEVTTTTELGKTVFAAFKSIEPGTSSTLVLHYRLPDRLAKRLAKDHQYQLWWQKQAGLESADISFHLSTPNQKPTQVDGLDNQAKLSKDSLQFSGSLREDRPIDVTFTQ